MWKSNLALTLFLIAGVAPAAAAPRTFTDDLGVTHMFEGKPKIVAWSYLAVSLFHLGMNRCVFDIPYNHVIMRTRSHIFLFRVSQD
jgi:hypothetical protein